MLVQVKLLNSEAKLPSYAHEGDAGLDLFSIEEKKINPSGSALIRTGICIALPPNTEAQIRPRSGLALKKQITVLNTPGTIDCGYRGEVCVILINHGQEPFLVEKGMKIAQMLVKPVYTVEIKAVDQLPETSRGEGGFGSTGV